VIRHTLESESVVKMMQYRSVAAVVATALIVLTGIVLVFSMPDGIIFTQYSGPFILYAILTAFALFFAAALLQGELSAAHAIGVLAALSLPPETRATMTWAIALGGLLGGGLVLFAGDRRLRGQRPVERSLRSLLLIIARVTLSYFVASHFFTLIGGVLPIQLDNAEQVVRILLFCIIYTGIYLLLFLLESYGRAYGLRNILRVNAPEILTVLGLPLPLAVLGAHIYNTLSLLAFAICMIGLGLAIVAPYIISRVQKQLRKQVEELRSLSIMSQAIRANQQYGSLMNMVYVQVSNLIDTRNFAVALYRPDEQKIEYPLVIRNGQQVDMPNQLLEPNAPVTRVIETQLPLLLARDAQKEGWTRGLAVPENTYSWLGVPLQAGGSLLGAMVVSSPDNERVFTPEDLRLLNIVAASASVALDNNLLYERQTERARRLSLLNSLLAQMTETLSLDAVLDAILVNIAQLSDADGVAILLANGDPSLKVARSVGLSETLTEQLPKLLGNSDSRQTQLIQLKSVKDDTQGRNNRELMTREGVNAWIELPLMGGGARFGALAIYYKRGQELNDEDVEVLRAFATQAAQAIQNANAYRRADEALSRRVGQLLALATISHELTATLDTETICSRVMEFALNATYTHIGTVMLKDAYGEIDIVAQYGYPLESVSRRELLRQKATKEALASGEPVRVADMSKQGDTKPLLPSLRAQLAVPIVRRGETIGVITLEADKPDAFSAEDEQFVQQLSDQAVIAIDNTRLFQSITEGRDRLQLILDNMSEPLLLIDRNGTIALANPRVDKLGLNPDVLLGQTVESLLAYERFRFAERLGFEKAEEVRAMINQLGTVAAQQSYVAHSFKLEDRDEVIYLQRNVLLVQGDSGKTIGLLLVFYDETEAKQLAEAREDFARMIIHDLRSPLTAVTTSLKLMNEIVPADSEYKNVIDMTSNTGRRAIKKLLNRVDSLLDVAKMESGQIALDTKPTELATLMDSVCVELSPLAHELEVRVMSELPDGFPLLAIDSDKVERVLLNLLDNALKFSPEAGAVTMRAFAPGSREAQPGYVRVEVVDQGPGVPQDYRETLFNRFVQVQGRAGRRRGTGLGLTFCRLVVESHGGRIWIEDNPAGGTIFAFTLPVAE